MKINLRFRVRILYILMVSLLWSTGYAQKRPLTHSDYDSWKSIVGPNLSPNGEWLCYVETPQDGDAFLVVKNLKTSKEYRHLVGYSGEKTNAEREARPTFSFNNQKVIFIISQSVEEVKKQKRNKKNKNKPVKKLGILDLTSGQTEVVDSVKSFALPDKNGNWLGYLLETPKKKQTKREEEAKAEKPDTLAKQTEKKKKEYGSPFELRNLETGEVKRFQDVLSFRFTKHGSWLFYIVSSKEKPETDGVYGLNLKTQKISPLLIGEGTYTKFTINEEETVLAFLTDRDSQNSKQPTFNLYGCKIGDSAARLWVSHKSTPGFPQGMAVSDKSQLEFSHDGKTILFGIKELPEEKTENDSIEVEEKAKFDLWHWNDPYPQPQQKKMATRVRNNTYESVYHIDKKKFIQLATPEIPDVNLHPTGKIGFALNPWPYTKKISYFGRFYDVFVFDLKSGKRTLVKKELFGSASVSPAAKYVYWFEGKDWFVYDVARKTTTNITQKIDAPFAIQDWDTPSPPRAYGVAGWTPDDASILVYDQFDIWEISPDGSRARMITEGAGRANHISFRIVKLDRKQRFIDPKAQLLLAARNEESMATGFYRDRIQGSALPEKLLMADKNFGRPSKAEQADVLLFSRSSFDEYPDLWISGLSFQSPRKVTDLGRQMEPFIWGKAELINFQSADGKPLKGILIKPENFDPNKQYPLLVYIYETLHYNLHRFRNPSPGTSINPSYYVSNGYLIWMPDIEYGTGYPGRDALKCVLPGIQMLIRRGFVNPKAIGIQGHSWGGYQIAYMVTQTNIFAAAEAGAPVSNMISAYNGIRWGSGMVRQFQYEHTQSRIGGSLWEYPLRYIENSPIFWADRVQTPLLMIHNDADGAVPWYQGIEYIMALRRLGKEAYMFNYNGEDHGLRKRVNQKDWTVRMSQFFDHFLKGAPKPDWMVNGIKAWEKEESKQ